jgi:hypothetical protein
MHQGCLHMGQDKSLRGLSNNALCSSDQIIPHFTPRHVVPRVRCKSPQAHYKIVKITRNKHDKARGIYTEPFKGIFPSRQIAGKATIMLTISAMIPVHSLAAVTKKCDRHCKRGWLCDERNWINEIKSRQPNASWSLLYR